MHLSNAMLSIFAAAAASVANAETAQEIVARSDAIRNPDQPFVRSVRLTDYLDGVPRQEIVLRVFSKIDAASGQFRNLVYYEEPPRDLGKAVLMNGGAEGVYEPACQSR